MKKHSNKKLQTSGHGNDCSCNKKVQELQETVEDLTSTLKHVQAEYQNYIKRVEKEKKDMAKYAGATVIRDFLPIVDNINRALASSENAQEFKQGIEMIRDQLQKSLENHNVTKMDALNEKFNPTMHEAMMVAESKKEPGTIIEVFEDGYMIKDRVLRHAKVKVSKAPDNDNEKKK